MDVEQLRALIKDGEVVNVIVVDENTDDEFLAAIKEEYDQVVDVTEREDRPAPGWVRAGNGRFVAPEPEPEREPDES